MNPKTLLKLLDLAMKAKAFLPAVFFAIELLKEFDRSLVIADGNPKPPAGFVYVLRVRLEGERFKLGYRSNPPWQDSQLKAELGTNGDFVLIIPAKNAKKLEKSFRDTFAKHSKKSDWCKLSEPVQQGMFILAAIVGLVAGDNLGMAPVNPAVRKLALDILNTIGQWATDLAKKKPASNDAKHEFGANQSAPDPEDFSVIPNFDWNWENVLTKDYRALPKLRGKEAYLTVICDNSARVGKVFIHSHPAKSIDAALAEQWQQFALELTLIMKVDKKNKVRRALQSSADEQGENGWVSFSDEAMGDVKQLARPFLYGFKPFLRPKTHWRLKTLASQPYRTLPKLRGQKGYVCVVQGSRRGNRYKIWRTHLPKDTGGPFGMAAQLNNPHDALHARNRVRFGCIIRSEYAESFETFLKERYAKSRRRRYFYETGDWYTLTSSQLQEIRNLGR